MKRAELYRVFKGSRIDPKRSRVFVVVSRQALLDSKYSTVICAPVYSELSGVSTQVPIGIVEGLKHEGSIHCDELISIPKSALTDYVGRLGQSKSSELNHSLSISLALQ